MQCTCGYLYSKHISRGVRKFESYALVDRRDYLAFLRSEMKVLGARSAGSRLRAIARSAEYVGDLLECPNCSRLLLVKPHRTCRRQAALLYKKDESSGMPSSAQKRKRK